MGNTVTCCVSPDASPKAGRDRGVAERGDPYQGEVELQETDPGPHLQHISDREFPVVRQQPNWKCHLFLCRYLQPRLHSEETL
ncbi:hypothetical protein GDO86_017117 [Hymenochirus boettgeri]|uniref:Uncharacterized protein n=1 Tax=Hymenochirus boettgeri TaxID=247094 RepID=A0A8T2INX9_9PIPI|nr:hypothetical protein GDO86_017117 [Hymenochirus boettgeri]